jgi:cytochrome c553
LDFVKLDESVTWERDDPHRKAYAALTSPLGRAMAAKLKRDVTTDTACLACHATDTKPAESKKTVSQFVRGESLGIGCQVCHGVGRDWQSAHYHIDESPTGATIPWRTKSPADKLRAGMTNLRDPAVKATLCASCHVGNDREGKVITHAMYVAGHPPLPPFELTTYLRDQPMHYRPTPDVPFVKSLAGVVAKATYSFFPEEGVDGQRARQTVHGILATLRSEATLISAEAIAAPAAGLDFARFDCYACHHELNVPSVRQKRGYDGPPGRPPAKAWLQAAGTVVAAQLRTIDDLKPHAEKFLPTWNALQKALVAKPFGDPEIAITAANALERWCDETSKRVAANPYFTADRVVAMRTAFRESAMMETTLADPEAAMLLIWAAKSLGDPAAAALETKLPTTVRTPDRLKRMNAIDPAAIRNP